MFFGQRQGCYVALQNLGDFYQYFYQTMITAMLPQMASVRLLFALVAITTILFFFIRMIFYCLLRKWKKRWEY